MKLGNIFSEINRVSFRAAVITLLALLFSSVAFGQLNIALQEKKDACDGDNGSIEIIVTNSIGSLNLFVIGGTVAESFIGVLEGQVILVENLPANAPTLDYLVVANDGVNPVATVNFIISTVTKPTASINTMFDNSSCASPNGSISLTVGGGTLLYTFIWTGPLGTGPIDGYPDQDNQSNLPGGDYSVEVIDDGSNCTVLLTSIILTDPTIDNSLTVSVVSSPICEGNSSSIDVLLSESGVSYQLRNNVDDSPVGASVLSVGGTTNLPTGPLLGTTIFNVFASNGVCAPVELTTLATVLVDPAPDAGLVVTAAADPICEGNSTSIDVSLSETGVSYQLRNDVGDAPVGAPVVGSGGTINLPTGVLTATTVFNVFATNGVCPSAELTTLVTVNVDAIPNAGLTVTAAVDPICEGGSTSIDVAVSEVGVIYQLRNDAGNVPVGAPVVSLGGTINLPTGVLTSSTIFNVLATNGVCTPVELTALATVNVDAAPNTGLAVSAASDPICEGSSTTIDVALSEIGYSYQLRNDAGDVNVGGVVIGNGGTINLPTGLLATTTIFNVLVTNGTCSIELTNLVTVNVDAAPNTGLVVTAAADPICEGSTTSIDVALSETGYNYQLRNDVGNVNVGTPVVGTGGTINLSTGLLSSTTTFNVLVTNGVCSVELSALTSVNVDASPIVGLAVTAAADPICEGSTTSIDVALSENGYSYQLRNDSDDSAVGPLVISGGGTTSLTTGVLITTTTFNVLVTNGVCSVELTALATVNVDAAPNLGLLVTAAADPICEGSTTSIDVALSEAGYSYQLRNDLGDVNVGTPVMGTGGTINLSTGALTATTTFNVLVTNGVCPPTELTALITVNVDAAPNVGLVVAATADPICEGSTTSIDVALSEAGYSYQLRNDIGNVNVGTPVVGTGGTINLSTGALTATTTFNVLVTNGVCLVELTALTTVNVDAAPIVGLAVAAAADPICEGSTTSIDVALSEAGYSYQLRNDAGDVNVGTPAVGTGGTINLSTGALTATTTFNVLVTNGVCIPVELTTLATVNVDAAPNVGLVITVAADPICEGSSTTIDVTLSEAGVSYQLRNDADDSAVGAPILSVGGTINLPTGAMTVTTVFNVFATIGICPAIELTTLVTITVNTAPDAGVATAQTTCSNINNFDLFTGLAGHDLSGAWADDDATGALTGSTFDATLVVAPGTYNFTYTAPLVAGCPSDTETLAVTVNLAPDAGVATAQTTCSDINNFDLFTGLAGHDLGGTWADDNASGALTANLFDATAVVPGTYNFTYTVIVAGCADDTESLAVTVNTAPNAGAAAPQSTCGSENSFDLFTGLSGHDTGGAWADDDATGALTGNIFDATLVSVPGTYNFTYTALSVIGCADDTETLSVSVFSSLPALSNQTTAVCQDSDFPTLIATPVSGAIVTWYIGSSATGTLVATGDTFIPTTAELDLAIPGTTSYTYKQDIGCLVSADATFDVEVEALPDAGSDNTIAACSSDPTIDLVTQLSGTPDTGGTWNDDDNSGALNNNGIFDPSTSGDGTFNFTYTVNGAGSCSTETVSAILTVSVSSTSIPPVPDQTLVAGCTYSDPPTLTSPGTGISWYADAALTNMVGSGNSYTPVDGTDIDMTFIGTVSYFVTQDEGCGESPAIQVDVVLEGVTADIGEIINTYPEQNIGAIEVINMASSTGSTPFEVRLEDDASNVIYDWIGVEADRLGEYTTLFTLLPEGNYVVLVQDASGCILPIDQSIILETDVFIPNVFTPNNDGYNEYFKVLNMVPNTQIIISNRWGVKVFESDDYQNDWQALNQSEGVYYYTIKMSGVVYQGYVEVWRNAGPAGSN